MAGKEMTGGESGRGFGGEEDERRKLFLGGRAENFTFIRRICHYYQTTLSRGTH